MSTNPIPGIVGRFSQIQGSIKIAFREFKEQERESISRIISELVADIMMRTLTKRILWRRALRGVWFLIYMYLLEIDIRWRDFIFHLFRFCCCCFTGICFRDEKLRFPLFRNSGSRSWSVIFSVSSRFPIVSIVCLHFERIESSWAFSSFYIPCYSFRL